MTLDQALEDISPRKPSLPIESQPSETVNSSKPSLENVIADILPKKTISTVEKLVSISFVPRIINKF